MRNIVIEKPAVLKKEGVVFKGENEDFKIAWLWVEGWRARFRGAGDVVEKARSGVYDECSGSSLRDVRRRL